MDSDLSIQEKTFLYYAYGSNLLKKRIHINNPTAKFISIARLDDHRLDFIKYSQHWGGASATIVPTANAHVWGSVWSVHCSNMDSLDKQEGVDSNWYFPKEVEVHTPYGATLRCRVYQQTVNPPPRGDGDPVPPERRPSRTYLQTIIKGAVDCNIPDYYVDMLKGIPHNGQDACESMMKLLADSDDE